MPLSKQALENKRNYNKEYIKTYRKEKELVPFTTYIPKNFSEEIKEYLKQNGFNKKDFVLSSFESLTSGDFELNKY